MARCRRQSKPPKQIALRLAQLSSRTAPSEKRPLTNSVLPVRDGPVSTKHLFLGRKGFVTSCSHASTIGQRGNCCSESRLCACAFFTISATSRSCLPLCQASKSQSRRASPFPHEINSRLASAYSILSPSIKLKIHPGSTGKSRNCFIEPRRNTEPFFGARQ